MRPPRDIIAEYKPDDVDGWPWAENVVEALRAEGWIIIEASEIKRLTNELHNRIDALSRCGQELASARGQASED